MSVLHAIAAEPVLWIGVGLFSWAAGFTACLLLVEVRDRRRAVLLLQDRERV